ncbi:MULTISPECIES: hypothetical protein [Streptomyces]|uniref:hypothetical protein n=1 Tax=Streptomyces TaxID=1883 RepID=UPI000F7890AC|nr:MULTISPECIES: hypothetical protein [Streptomyces]RST07758.1 hypothetical protein EF910_04740 [Streptomyces sp. WAC07149]GLX17334.1 hypothetical protein Slala01_09780 [Streptomyces lavendulae subsp. lavendulae]GLX24807.1 hypothetical protein Slala02_06270 [Streptomyces lavendulae subsp. lavendulae]
MTQSPTAEAAEIKVSFAGTEAAAAFDALGLDRDEGRRRSVHFWDRPARTSGAEVSLPLLERGVILRLRRDREGHGSKEEADLTVKLRPSPGLPPRWLEERKGEDWEYRIEEDRAAPAFKPVVAASLEAGVGFAASLDPGSPGRLLVEEQLELLGAAGPVDGGLDGLTALGPVHAVKWKQEWEELPRAVAVEEWTTEGGLRFVEVSVRADVEDAADAQQLLDGALRARGLALPATGDTKTRIVMTALARALPG